MERTEVLTAIEACRRLGVTLDYLYRLVWAKRLPGKKLDGVWQIPASAVEARLRERKVAT